MADASQAGSSPASAAAAATAFAAAAVSVVVVTYNGAPWIRRCLASLAAGTLVPHVIVVDNASQDDTAAIVGNEFPHVELVRSNGNAGFGIGNNIGIRRALDGGADFVFLLNQDAFVLPATLQQLARFLEDNAEFGVASPLHCSPDAEHVDRKTLRGYLQTRLPEYLADACMGRVQPHYRTHGVNAAAWFVRSSVFRTIGGFDPLFFMYGEDDDLLCRMAHHRVGFALLTGCRVVHLRESPTSPPPRFGADIRRRAERRRSELLTRLKRPGFSVPHMLAVLLADGWIAPLADALVLRDGRDYIASGVAAWRVAFELPRVVRHARLSAQPGAHFL